MAMQLGALRAALAEAGASDEKAQRAAEELASYDREFAGIRSEISEMRSDLKLMKWMLGVISAGVIATTLRVFIH